MTRQTVGIAGLEARGNRMGRKAMPHICTVCGREYQSVSSRSKYCSDQCRQHAFYVRKRAKYGREYYLNTHKKSDDKLARLATMAVSALDEGMRKRLRDILLMWEYDTANIAVIVNDDLEAMP